MKLSRRRLGPFLDGVDASKSVHPSQGQLLELPLPGEAIPSTIADFSDLVRANPELFDGYQLDHILSDAIAFEGDQGAPDEPLADFKGTSSSRWLSVALLVALGLAFVLYIRLRRAT